MDRRRRDGSPAFAARAGAFLARRRLRPLSGGSGRSSGSGVGLTLRRDAGFAATTGARWQPGGNATVISSAASARGRSGERGRAPLPISRRAGLPPFGGDHFCHRFLGPHGSGADPGRVALPMLRRRSGGGPVPPGGGLQAASAGGRSSRRANGAWAPQRRSRPCFGPHALHSRSPASAALQRIGPIGPIGRIEVWRSFSPGAEYRTRRAGAQNGGSSTRG